MGGEIHDTRTIRLKVIVQFTRICSDLGINEMISHVEGSTIEVESAREQVCTPACCETLFQNFLGLWKFLYCR